MEEKFNYFMERTAKDIDEVKADVKSVKDGVQELLKFKWQIIGGATVISIVASILVNFVAYGLTK